jgi:hypothetical protein
LHPRDDIDCGECLKWLRGKDRLFLERPKGSGRRVPLPVNVVPCQGCGKIPPGADPHWTNAVTPTPLSRRLFALYLECRAVNWQCPEARDPFIRRAAAVIRAVEDGVERARADGLLAALAAAAKGK